MAGRFVKLLLFGSSYSPLGAIFFLLYLSQDKRWQAWICLAVSILCVGAFLYYFTVRVPGRARFPITVASLRRRDGDALSYIATYLIPFVTVPFFDKWQETAALVFFFVVLAVVYINSDLIAVNPLLTVLRYRFYEVTIMDDPSSYMLLSKERIIPNKEFSVADITEGVYLRT